ncbi:hypothetical protein HPB48_013857 [Haemaphysalis longicornis]|uniref:Uncharacterized protein n=1 Tax=Haemaphysalis longicornis TaxID=44386 RepID=A0A9J6G5Y6_HAELO|nr:hypothetical protein HPB48_013857 [Haemaphysalis longicornis]
MVMAPTVAALAKDFEEFKTTFEAKLSTLTSSLETVKCAVVKCKPEEVKQLQNDMEELKKSLDFINNEFEAVKLQNTTLVATNKKLVESNDVLARKVAALEQYSRANNLEIRGVPVTQGEECLEIVKQLGDAIGCTVQTEDIDTAHRVPTHNANHKNIIVRFCSRDKRTEFLSNARKSRPTTSCLGVLGESSLGVLGESSQQATANTEVLIIKLAHSYLTQCESSANHPGSIKQKQLKTGTWY